ncbi:MAG: Cobalt-zinc-cadmium resistance protein [uncultured Solirubrobacteraceae bacterium]|uniref:Cobalt-zinc-cadmium resistance protein n=1 Tax=uncultured Solirubrobacteraceae bacterium TaxID=1162706 RepID=A0A6J4S7G2_9ACTN|nr:MAG: Cobalt-zinc-cadmium resistance protein [uncultured Solirubrobacteraceae bacterium]
MAPARVGTDSRKTSAALLSIASNTVLIALKIVAGVITGSVAILTEALHSGIDLIASVIAYISVRRSDQPPDRDHPFGHQKYENLAAAFEGVLILVGAGIVVFESVRRLGGEANELEEIPLGIAIIALTIVVNVVVSTFLGRRARETESAALEGDAAHLRTDAATSIAVLLGLALVHLTGYDWLDPVIALVVAVAIVTAGWRLVTRSSRVLVDETLPDDELEAIRQVVLRFGPRGVAGFHKLRARHAGAFHHVDMHVQFRAGTTLEDAHDVAHALQDEIAAVLDGADVLIHLEPEDRVRPGTEVPRGDFNEG